MPATCSVTNRTPCAGREPQVKDMDLCPRTDTHLNYMTGVVLTAEFSLATGGVR
jgi:hypothetical protein